MAERKESYERAAGNRASARHITYRLQGSGLSLDLYMRGDAFYRVSLTVGGLQRPDLPAGETGIYYGGKGTKDPRLMPLVEQFEKDLLKALDLEHTPLQKGFFRKKPLTVTVESLTHSGLNEMSMHWNVKDDDSIGGVGKQQQALYARLAEAVDRLVPGFERAAAAAMAQALPKQNLRGESAVEEVTRRRMEAITELPVVAELSAVLQQKYGLPHAQAVEITTTALKFLRDRGLFKPPGRGRDTGSN